MGKSKTKLNKPTLVPTLDKDDFSVRSFGIISKIYVALILVIIVIKIGYVFSIENDFAELENGFLNGCKCTKPFIKVIKRIFVILKQF